MEAALTTLASLMASIHIYVFFLESIAWGKPNTNKTFGLRSQADAEANRKFAFNQGFYNLFLAIALIAGLILARTGYPTEGGTLQIYAALSIFGAGAVLYASTRMLPGALMQAAPAALFLILRFFF